jgi:hypothetical protein
MAANTFSSVICLVLNKSTKALRLPCIKKSSSACIIFSIKLENKDLKNQHQKIKFNQHFITTKIKIFQPTIHFC